MQFAVFLLAATSLRIDSLLLVRPIATSVLSRVPGSFAIKHLSGLQKVVDRGVLS